MSDQPRPEPKPPKAVPEGIDEALRKDELKRSRKLDPAQRLRQTPLSGQKLFGKDRARPDTNDLEEDEYNPPGHPQRDS